MEINSLVGTLICIVMLVSGYKSLRQPDSKFLRIASWTSTAILGLFLFALSVVEPEGSQETAKKALTSAEVRSYVSAMEATEKFLMRLPGVKGVGYSSSDGDLKITVMVSSELSEEKEMEMKDEITREFLHNWIDELDNPGEYMHRGEGVRY